MTSELLQNLHAQTLSFYPVRRHHQDYIYSLRTDPAYNRHLSAAPTSVEKQGEWIDSYVEREERGEEFYFLIVRKDGCPCGTVRLYDFKEDSFCWGSWILDQSKPRFAAVESALLVYEVGFERLRFQQSHFDVRIQNTRVIRFHERMGAVKTKVVGEDQHMVLTKASFELKKPELLRLVTA